MASRTSRKTRTRSEMTPQSTGATTGYEAELWDLVAWIIPKNVLSLVFQRWG